MANRCFCCIKWKGYGEIDLDSSSRRLLDIQELRLDTTHMGYGVVIVKNGHRICGTGGALANAPIEQSKAYFEAKLQSSGVWGIGVATRQCNLQRVPLGVDSQSWVLRHDGALYHNGQEVRRLKELPQEGDVIGIAYNHVELNIFVNGRPTDTSFTGIRGTIYPVVYVDEGAILDMQFTRFHHDPPAGFEQIMIEKSIL